MKNKNKSKNKSKNKKYKNKKDFNSEESDIVNKLNLLLNKFGNQISILKEKLEYKFQSIEEDIKQIWTKY